MEVESSFEYLGSSLSKDGGPQEDVKLRVDGELKTFRAIKIMVNVRMDVERELHDRVSVLMVVYGPKTWGMMMDKGYKLDFVEMICLRMCVVTRIGRWRNKEVRHRIDMER